MFEWTKWRNEYLTTPSLTNHSAVLMLKVLHQTSIAWEWEQILNFWHLNRHPPQCARTCSSQRSWQKASRSGLALCRLHGHCNSFIDKSLEHYERGWSWPFSAPEGIFQSQFAEIWAKRENDEKAAHAQILQVEFLLKKYHWKCWSPSLLLWKATSSLLRLPYLFITSSIVTCRFSRRSCRLLTCRPSLITKANMVSPTTTKVNPTVSQPPNSKR